MGKLEKSLLIGAAALVAYAASRRATRTDVASFYRGRAVAVTGAASGIGRALAARLRASGARVLAVDVDADALAALREDLPGVAALELDLAERAAPEQLLAAAVERLGGLDVLFSNAGLIWAAPFLSMTDDDIERLVEVNFTMQARLTRHVVPFMEGHGGGVIAYTGSMSSFVYSPLHSVYTGTKGGLKNFVSALRRELRRERSPVRLTIIHPNMTRTELAAGELFDEILKTYHLQTPEQVADAFLRGVAEGRAEVFVEVADYLWIWAERLAPRALDALFRHAMTDELVELAESAVADSKLRRQLAARRA